MKVLTLTLASLVITSAAAQSVPDYEKLAKACEAWGLIKYFHPSKPGDDFDSVFAARVPAMLAADNDDAWTSEVAAWLKVLNDRATGVRPDLGDLEPEGTMTAGFNADSILVVRISGTAPLDDFSGSLEFFHNIGALVDHARHGIIFDLRQDGPVPPQHAGYLAYFFSDLNKKLATDVVPQYRAVHYSGFKPETRTTSGGYTINETLTRSVPKGTFHKKGQRVVWIINDDSELPVIALAQQASGVGIILSSSHQLPPDPSTVYRFPFLDGIELTFSGAALLTTHEPTADEVYQAGEDPMPVAIRLLQGTTINKAGKEPVKTSTNWGSKFPAGSYPDVGYRVLAAAKIFTVIETFFPYHQFMDKSWRTVLVESLPDFVNASDEYEYGLAVAKMYTQINDAHGFISGNKGLDRLRGEAVSPVSVGWVENKVVIMHLRNDSVCRALGLNVGDVILQVNGKPVESLIEKIRIHVAHSNKDFINHRAAQYAIRGPQGETGTFRVQGKDGKVKNIAFKWSNEYNKGFQVRSRQDTLAMLSDNIGYADLTRMEVGQTDKMFDMFKDTRAIVFDMRGYPNGTAWSIAPRLTEQRSTPLALFRKPEVLAPSIPNTDIVSTRSYTEFVQTVAPTSKWKYKGRTVMLINQDAMSQAEHTGLFFEASNNTIFIGSPTAGANGDVTDFLIPGGMVLTFSGQGVWHADGRQLQRLGLQPHVEVRPTIKGIRAGKDEVLDAAVMWIRKNTK